DEPAPVDAELDSSDPAETDAAPHAIKCLRRPVEPRAMAARLLAADGHAELSGQAVAALVVRVARLERGLHALRILLRRLLLDGPEVVLEAPDRGEPLVHVCLLVLRRSEGLQLLDGLVEKRHELVDRGGQVREARRAGDRGALAVVGAADVICPGCELGRR